MHILRRLPLVAILLALGITGCDKSPSNSTGGGGTTAGSGTAAASGKKYRIAVIPKGTSHEFWKSVEAGVRKAADEDGVEVVFKGPPTEGDISGQINLVEQSVANNYDAICLAPNDAVALRKSVDQAIAANIPVIIFDSGLNNMEGVASFVATNNRRAGQRAGEYLIELLGGKGHVILMRYQIGSKSTEDREQGFLDALAKAKDIELLSSDKHSGPQESEAVKLGENFLEQFGEKIDGIFCPNESTASGMLTAVKRDPRGLGGKIKFIGFDSSDNLVQGLKDGILFAVVVQDPVKMGHDAVHTAVRKLRGEKVEPQIDVPENLARPKNMNDPKIDALLHPAKAR